VALVGTHNAFSSVSVSRQFLSSAELPVFAHTRAHLFPPKQMG
jgi:hypothetical protein